MTVGRRGRQAPCSLASTSWLPPASGGAHRGLLLARELAELRAGQRDQVRRRQLDLQPAPPRADEDRLPLVDRGIDRRWQPLALAERADPADDVARRALGFRLLRELRAPALGPQGELLV